MDGHPLPASDEARHDEIPEDLERRKGVGDDDESRIQSKAPVDPGGKSYGEDAAGEFEMTASEDRADGAPPSSQDVANREAADRPPAGERKGAAPRPGGVEGAGSDRQKGAEAEFGRDQRAHQDQGQSDIERD
jgi:hypothetical protein